MKYSIITLLLTIIIISCNSNPEPINYGEDECEFCRMLITDKKYGAELVTTKGKIYKFDSIECLIEFSLVENTIGDLTNNLFVTDFSNSKNLINAREAFYVKNDKVRSPMGLNVTAFKDKTLLNNFISENSGNQMSWVEVIELVKQKSNY